MTKAISPTPLYHRVYAVMRERIVNGYYPDNVPVPSEAELSGSFGVSRITIRKAMEMLSAEGLITRMRGRGTFVTDRAQKSALNRAVVLARVAGAPPALAEVEALCERVTIIKAGRTVESGSPVSMLSSGCPRSMSSLASHASR